MDLQAALRAMVPVHRGQDLKSVLTEERINAIQDAIIAMAGGKHMVSGVGVRLTKGGGGVKISSKPGTASGGGGETDHPWKMHATENEAGDLGVWLTPGTISSARAFMNTAEYLDTKYGEPPVPPMLAIPEGRHIVALKITWEPNAFEVPGGKWALVAGGAVESLEVITVPEDDWDTTLDTDTVIPVVDADTGTITNGVFFQRVGVCEVSDVAAEGEPAELALTLVLNDSIVHSGTGHFCAPEEFWISII